MPPLVNPPSSPREFCECQHCRNTLALVGELIDECPWPSLRAWLRSRVEDWTND